MLCIFGVEFNRFFLHLISYNWLENRVKALEEELKNSKTDFENLEMLYKNSFCKCDSLVCENCESLEKKVHYLVKTVDKLSKDKSNFVFLEKLNWVLIHRTSFQTLFQKCQKNNRLLNRNNWLLHVLLHEKRPLS